ncbi:MAG: sulfotransferase [Dehalococcoidia bacterium]|nr:sulfotransferase [Dehalococcoidia bacterium]
MDSAPVAQSDRRWSSPARPTRVLFIAGMGRSGSTLIEQLLGEVPGVFSAGEVRYIWDRGFAGNELCGCGNPFHTCEVWSEVVQEGFGTLSREDLALIQRRREIVDRLRITMLAGLPVRNRSHDAALATYQDALLKLFGSIRQATGATVIVDSSKTPSHGFILAASPEVQLDVVHVVRDSRAVAFSWQRLRRRPEITDREVFMPRYRPPEAAGRWAVHNLTAPLLGLRAHSYRRVLYEDFVRDPRATLQTILAPYPDLDRQLSFLDGHEATVSAQHTVAGNPIRFQQGPLKIRPDDESRTMSRRDRAMVTALTWPLLLRYGYLP